MTTQQKGIRQPLGTIQSIDKVLTGIPPNMAFQQTRNLKIIYAKRKLQVDIPVKWTINKVKCMLCTHFDILNFNNFQFQCNKMLIPGKTLVGHLPDDELIVTKADCPNAFEKYYSKTIKQVIKKHNINTQSTLLPILVKDISQAMRYSVTKERRKNFEQFPQNRNQRRQEEDGVLLINLLRVIGLAFMANIVFSFASYWQICVLVFIIGLYYLIDVYVKENQRRRTRAQREAQKREEQEKKRKQDERKANQIQRIQRENNKSNKKELQGQQKIIPEQNKLYRLEQHETQEKEIKRKDSESNESNLSNLDEQTSQRIEEPQMVKKPERKILRAKLKLWMAFIIEFIYCFLLSIFPNWTVQTHLHANQKAMDKVMNEVKLLHPEASEQVKKWEIKEQIGLNHDENSKGHEELKAQEHQHNE